MFWLCLLGLVTFLAIVVRRLWHRQKPLIDDLYAKRMAIDHVHDGVAWVTGNGRIDYLNPALARMLDSAPEQLTGRTWFTMFAPEELSRVEDAYSQMLLSGKAWLDANVIDSRGEVTQRSLLIVAVYDHKTRLSGHHCILHDAVRQGQAEEHLACAGQN
jgi:PAS domain S-box-containing protein